MPTFPSEASALLSFLLHSLITILVSIACHDLLFTPPSPTPPTDNQQSLSSFLLLYATFTAISRYIASKNKPPPAAVATIYELCWACNSALVLSSISFLTSRPDLAVAAGVAVSIDQILWYVDIIGYYVYPRKKFIIGVCTYLTWKTTSWTRIITSTHHLWTMPLIIFGVDGNVGGWGFRQLALSHVIVGVHVLCSRWLTPNAIGGIYLNINLGYDLWLDIKKLERHFVWLFRISDERGIVFIPRLLFRWFGFNTICYGLLWVGCYWLY